MEKNLPEIQIWFCSDFPPEIGITDQDCRTLFHHRLLHRTEAVSTALCSCCCCCWIGIDDSTPTHHRPEVFEGSVLIAADPKQEKRRRANERMNEWMDEWIA